MMTQERYWELVNTDPRPLSHDQKVLFWWVVMLLPMIKDQGAIVTPDPAPLTSDQVREVLDLLKDTTTLYGESWSLGDVEVIVPTSDGEVITT